MRSAGALCAAVATTAAVAAAPAHASFDACTYDGGSRTATASLVVSHTGTLSVAADGSIAADGTSCDGATTSNTDEVSVTGTSASDVVTVDLGGSGGTFEKAGGDEEVHFDVALGEADWCNPEVRACVEKPQLVRIRGTSGADDIRAGARTLVNFDAADDADADLQAPDSRVELDGGAGPDTLTGLGGSGAGATPADVVLRGGAGNDVLATGGQSDLVYPGPGSDEVHVDGDGSGEEEVSYAGAPGPVVTDTYDGVVDDGTGARDWIDGHFDVLRGSAHDDVLHALSPVTLGGGGDDHLFGGSWAGASLVGGAGDDTLDGGGDPYAHVDPDTFGERLAGGPGDDRLEGTRAPDTLSGGPGRDRIYGHRGEFTTIAGGYRSTVRDTLYGGPGDDFLSGGPDGDDYYFEAPLGHETDTIDERPDNGRDKLDLSYGELDFHGQRPIPLEIDLSSETTRLGRSGNRTLLTRAPRGGSNLEDVVATIGDDRIVGNGRPNRIFSEGGDDRIACRGGRDVVVGAAAGAQLSQCEVVR